MDSQMGMLRYEAYKDSGVEWLGEIPEHWRIVPLKHSLTLISEKISSQNSTLKYYGMENIESWTGRFIETDTEVEGLANKFNDKDILFGKLRPYLAKVALTQNQGICSTEFLVYRVKKHSSDFFKYFLVSTSFITLVDALTYGSKMPRANADFIGIQRVSIPPFNEQTAIANFLDRKTAQIDQAITIKEKQIALLKERKQILIQNAVTRGLDPTVPMKDSGVEWIGEIPVHWEIVPMKRLANISPSIKVKNKNSDELVCFLPMEKVSVEGHIECDVKLPIKDVSQGFTAFAKNDVIVAKITPCFENGKSAYLENLETPIGYGSTEFHVLRSSKSIMGQLLFYIIRSHLFLNAGEAMMTGSAGQKRVPTDFVSGFPVSLPPINEQNQIFKYISKSTKAIEHAVELQKKQISQLKEYKATLINSAVTGKIKVVEEEPNQSTNGAY